MSATTETLKATLDRVQHLRHCHKIGGVDGTIRGGACNCGATAAMDQGHRALLTMAPDEIEAAQANAAKYTTPTEAR